MRVQVTEGAGDGLGSVGLLDNLDIAEALSSVTELASLIRSHLQPVMPTKATVEFGVSFSIKAGKLVSLMVDGKGDASLKVTLEWEARGEPAVPDGS